MIPLSTRMRPDKIEDFVGQEHFLYEGSLLYNAIKQKTFDSGIFFGPSGTGKTTLARIIAKELDGNFYELNASLTGIQELKSLIDKKGNQIFGLKTGPTYIYVDEFHRWNKLQQDVLLKALEDGTIRLIGSTTENPYFSVNNAVLSRVRNIYEFKPLSSEAIKKLLLRAISDENRGLGSLNLSYGEEALTLLADMSSGDGRVALDTLGFMGENLSQGESIDAELVSQAMQRKTTFFDKKEDKYNLLSALQKSIRGSNPDAAIHYLARLLEGGGDLQMIGRRLVVIASEDIGMAYPSAISIVTSCVQAALMAGLPEGRINLSQAVILMASCPKSNAAYQALETATEDLRRKKIDDVPNHLKDAHYDGAKDRGIGLTYRYPHAYGGYVKQQYLPDNLHKEGVRYYHPTENGKEAAFKKFLEELEEFYERNS